MTIWLYIAFTCWCTYIIRHESWHLMKSIILKMVGWSSLIFWTSNPTSKKINPVWIGWVKYCTCPCELWFYNYGSYISIFKDIHILWPCLNNRSWSLGFLVPKLFYAWPIFLIHVKIYLKDHNFPIVPNHFWVRPKIIWDLQKDFTYFRRNHNTLKYAT